MTKKKENADSGRYGPRKKKSKQIICIEDPTTQVRGNFDCYGNMPEDEREKLKEAFAYNAGIGMSDIINRSLVGISYQTQQKWMATDPIFAERFQHARDITDSRVIDSIYAQATGFHKMVKKPMIISDGDGMSHVEIVEYEHYFPPSFKAGAFWLTNRRGNEWQMKQDITFIQDKVRQMTDEQLTEQVKQLIDIEATSTVIRDEDED